LIWLHATTKSLRTPGLAQWCPTFLSKEQFFEKKKQFGRQIFGSKAHGGKKNALLTILSINIVYMLYFYFVFLSQKSWRAFEKVSEGIKMPEGTRWGTAGLVVKADGS
jgi:hypothetical protein